MTAQTTDIIIIDGEKLQLFSNPLESYFNEDNPKPDVFRMRITANWRGYVATWEISEDTLYLVDINVTPRDDDKVSVATIFPDSPGKIKADWFSGTLRIPRGKCIRYVHLGYGSIYEKELMIGVENGIVKRREIIDNKKRFKGKGGLDRHEVTEAMKLFTKWAQLDVDKHAEILRVPTEKKRDDDRN